MTIRLVRSVQWPRTIFPMQTQYVVIIVFFAWICPKLTKGKLIGLGDMNREELKMRKKISLLNDITLQLLYFPIALI